MQKKNILLLSCGKQLQEDYAYITMRQVSIAEIKGLYCYNCCLFYVGNAMEAINNRRDGSEAACFYIGGIDLSKFTKIYRNKNEGKIKNAFLNT